MSESIDKDAARISRTMVASPHQVGSLLRDGWTEAEIELAHRIWCSSLIWPTRNAIRKVFGPRIDQE